MSKFKQVNEYSLFAPKGISSLFRDYPELRDNPDLEGLLKPEVLFCYYLGCQTSPLYEAFNEPSKKSDDKTDAVTEAAKRSGLRISEADDMNYKSDFIYPSKIEAGIKAFRRYEPKARIRVRKIREKMLDNIEKAINADLDSDEFKSRDKKGEIISDERDFDKVSKYVSTCKNAEGMFEPLLKNIEYGEALSKKEVIEEKSDGISFIDQKHES